MEVRLSGPLGPKGNGRCVLCCTQNCKYKVLLAQACAVQKLHAENGAFEGAYASDQLAPITTANPTTADQIK